MQEIWALGKVLREVRQMGGDETRTASISRPIQRDRKGYSEEDERGGDRALHDICELELAQLDEVVADPAVLDDGEDRAQPDADDEHEQEHAVEAAVALRVEDGEQDEAAPADEGAQDRERGEYPLASAHALD